jgi:hypothetical protein
MLTILLGSLLGKADPSQYSKAEQRILQGLKSADELKMRPWLAQGYICLGEFYADAGQDEKALEALKRVQADCQAMGIDYWLRRTESVLERLQS